MRKSKFYTLKEIYMCKTYHITYTHINILHLIISFPSEFDSLNNPSMGLINAINLRINFKSVINKLVKSKIKIYIEVRIKI